MKILSIKAIVIVLVFICNSAQAQSGGIGNIYVVPANPTIHDSITFLAETGFPSGGCNIKSHHLNIDQNVIRNLSQYCIGIFIQCHVRNWIV